MAQARHMKRLLGALLGFLIWMTPAIADNGSPVYVMGGALAPNTNQITETAVTCGATSTPFGVTGAAYLAVQTPIGGVTVCFGVGTNAATLNPPSKCYPGGTDFQFAGGTGTCIVAASTQAISVWTK